MYISSYDILQDYLNFVTDTDGPFESLNNLWLVTAVNVFFFLFPVSFRVPMGTCMSNGEGQRLHINRHRWQTLQYYLDTLNGNHSKNLNSKLGEKSPLQKKSKRKWNRKSTKWRTGFKAISHLLSYACWRSRMNAFEWSWQRSSAHLSWWWDAVSFVRVHYAA